MHCQAIPPWSREPRQPVQGPVFSPAALLAQHRLRPTLARLCILELFQEGHALTPEQVYRALVQRGGDASLATTYRTLAQFLDAGLLGRQQLDNGPGRYYLPKARPDEHLLCTECGAMMALPGPDIAKVLEKLAAKHGYLLSSYELALQGRCLACKKSAA